MFPHYVLPFRNMSFQEVYDLAGPNALNDLRQVISDQIPAKYRAFCDSIQAPMCIQSFVDNVLSDVSIPLPQGNISV